MENNSIFKGLKILELSSVLAGPAVGMFFAELGATIIKIENKTTHGDITRKWKLPEEDPNIEYSAYYLSTNWGKEIIFSDLRNPTDKEHIYSLIKECDIVISNFKQDSAIKLQFDYSKIKSLNPKVIYGQIQAYSDAPQMAGFDAKIQAETGWMYMNGQSEGPPTKIPVAIIDLMAAHQLKEGILVALIHRFKTGLGSKVTTSLFDSAIASLANQGSSYLNNNIIPVRKGSLHPTISPYGETFKTSDGYYILLAIGTDKQFELMCSAFSIVIEGYNTNHSRVKYRQQLGKILQISFLKFNKIEVEKISKQHNLPISSIKNLDEVFDNPYTKNLILKYKHDPNLKCLKTVSFKID